MTICKMLISYVKLDHTLYSINYGIWHAHDGTGIKIQRINQIHTILFSM
jgi:hypothetical protein